MSAHSFKSGDKVRLARSHPSNTPEMNSMIGTEGIVIWAGGSATWGEVYSVNGWWWAASSLEPAEDEPAATNIVFSGAVVGGDARSIAGEIKALLDKDERVKIDLTPPRIQCGCKRHLVTMGVDAAGRDIYQQHNAWIDEHAIVEMEPTDDATKTAVGVRASKPVYEPGYDCQYGEEFER